MNNHNKKEIKLPARYILYFLVMACMVLLTVNYFRPGIFGPVSNGVNQVLMPLQKGINHIGSGFADTASEYKDIKQLKEENDSLKEELASLKEQISNYQAGQTELAQLRSLLSLSGEYSDYEMTGARVIQKDAGNWFHSFIIDKGSNDGIEVDMNVISDGGLVGIVTQVGTNYAKVRSIIDDDSNVSAMSLSSGDTCIVAGDLQLFDQGKLQICYVDKDDNIWDDDKIVTSNISAKYLPGILIGYATDMKIDANNITKSGYLIPVVDFEHLQTVLVIKTKKVTGKEN